MRTRFLGREGFDTVYRSSTLGQRIWKEVKREIQLKGAGRLGHMDGVYWSQRNFLFFSLMWTNKLVLSQQQTSFVDSFWKLSGTFSFFFLSILWTLFLILAWRLILFRYLRLVSWNSCFLFIVLFRLFLSAYYLLSLLCFISTIVL